jgi:hypothetical protein
MWDLLNHGYFQVMDAFSHEDGVILKIQSRNIKYTRFPTQAVLHLLCSGCFLQALVPIKSAPALMKKTFAIF